MKPHQKMSKPKNQIKPNQTVVEDKELSALVKMTESMRTISIQFWSLNNSDERTRAARYVINRFGDFLHNFSKISE